MTNKQTCDGLDCAWCGALDCPREKKEIFVDGVNVSKCENYSKHREGYCGWYIPCEGESCSYKIKWALEQLTKSEARIKELEEYKKSKQASYEAMQAKNNTLEWEKRELEKKVKELEEKLNAQFAEMEEKLAAEEMKNFELREKLKIAKEALTSIESQSRSCWCKFCKDNIRKSLQKMKQIDLNNNLNPKKTIKIFGKEIDEDVARKVLQQVLDGIADYEEECKKNGKNTKEVSNE